MKGSNILDEEVVVTFSDFTVAIRRHKKSIAIATLFFALLGALVSLNRPIKYQIEASFKEKGVTSSGSQNSNIGDLFSSKSGSKQSEAKTWFSSHAILKKVVVKENLHGVITPAKRPLFSFPKVMFDNIKVEVSHYRNRPSPYLKEVDPLLLLKEVVYSNELPTQLLLTVDDEEQFTVAGTDGKEIGRGRFGETFAVGSYSFVVARQKSGPLSEKVYEITLSSPDRVAKGLKELIQLKTDSTDNELIHLSTLHVDRKRGAELINAMIDVYKEHKVEEQKRVSSEQIAYLEERQGEAEAVLRQEMELFASEQAKGFESGGFVDSDNALEFLAVRQHELKRRLLSIELEEKRLKKALSDGQLFYDRYGSEGDTSLFSQLMGEIRQLKQQGDSIKLSLQESPHPFDDQEKLTFNRQMAELEDTRSLIQELKAIESELAKGHLLRPSDSLINDPRIMLNNWYEKLEEYQQEREWSQISPSDWESRKTQFATYISNLIELFEVHEKALRERLAHHGDMKEEFKGIDLQLAGELFVGYNRALSDTETELVKLQFLLEEMHKPHFEINSLTSHLHDQVSRELIANYSKLLLDLQDGRNRSQKEQERIRNELLRQRKFLEMHISQTLALHNVTAGLQREKIHSLQKVTLALIQLKISLLEKQLENLIVSRIGNLESEKGMIVDQLTEIKKEMTHIPEKKIAEQLMQQRLDKSRDFGKEITRLVESKNITNNLEVVLSKAVDEAVVPIYPRRPMLLIYTAAAALFGLMFSLVAVCAIEAFKGVAASEENLRRMGYNVAIGGGSEENAIRRAVNAVTTKKERGPLLFVGNNATEIARSAALLLNKRGCSTLLLCLTECFRNNGKIDLYDYLEGKSEEVSIDKKEDVHVVAAKRLHPYRSELTATERFKNLIIDLEQKYDWLLIASDDSAACAEVEPLFATYDDACICLSSERLHALQNPLKHAREGKNFIFIFKEEEKLC